MSRLVMCLMVLSIILIYSPAFAQAPDFSICSEQRGAAFGLCRGGVAIGCDMDDSSNACAQIAEQFEQITGELPAWVVEVP